MGVWDDIRRQARQQHALVRAVAADDSAAALLVAAEQLTGIERIEVPGRDPLLDGGEAVLDSTARVIYYNGDLDPRLAAFFIAHEYAHEWRQHARYARCTIDDVDPQASEVRVPLGIQRVEGYGPEERCEREANVFAREFLLPANLLRRLFLDEGLDASVIAEQLGLLEGMVLHQLAVALLTPELSTTEPERNSADVFDLDPSQRKAAEAAHGPLLIVAGPGTGKTQALIGRVTYLLRSGVPPDQILALTFSNRAAEELRGRVADVAPDAASHLWAGTFHAFGLEMLRKFGRRLGLPSHLDVIDPVDAVVLLEQHLAALDLHWYLDLREPTRPLREILAAISRAKDEYVGPERYTALAQEMLKVAQDARAVEAAEKALEVAHVYTFYQDLLTRNNLLDFGDLIMRTIDLFRTYPDIRAVIRQTYRQVLVDEYQDVNSAGALFLREIAGDGYGLWAVGDVRQAIYRFRGAAPRYVRQFDQDFPGGEVKLLTHNYRSGPAIVEVFAALAPHMRAARSMPFTPWEPVRSGDRGSVRMEVATDAAAEIAGVADAIRQQYSNGVRYRDQVVLCRSHTMLARVADGLEQAGIPTLYLGDIFTRPEVRDMLALLALACEPDGRALVRIACFAEYQIPLADAQILLDLAWERQMPFPQALDLAKDADTLSLAGKEGIDRLARHLDGLCYGSSAWGLLVRYLFIRSDYARILQDDESIGGQQRRLAIFLLLQLAYEQRGRQVQGTQDPKRAFLQYVRQLAMSGEDTQLRQVPDLAAEIDAVRLLTIHASKGLEFSAVYLPGLGQGYFPARRQGQPCPPPDGMLAESADDDHEAEEECLFFVALSRARDALCLSRARRYGRQNSNPARFLTPIAHRLPHPPDGPITWTGMPSAEVPLLSFPDELTQPTFDAASLDTYIACPRQYAYEHEFDLRRRRDRTAYEQYHHCVYNVLRWMQDEQAAGKIADELGAHARLVAVWGVEGPCDHAYAAVYWEHARQLVARAVERTRQAASGTIRPALEVELPHGRVRVTPDHIIVREQGNTREIIVRRLRTGRPSSAERERNIYALYQTAAERAYPGAVVQTEVVYLATDTTEPIRLNQGPLTTRLERYDAAITGIQQGAFPAQPDDHRCPRCPYFFICPLGGDK